MGGEHEGPRNADEALRRSADIELERMRSTIERHAERCAPYFEDTRKHDNLLYGVDGNNGLVGRMNAVERLVGDIGDDIADSKPKADTIDWKRIERVVLAAAAMIGFIAGVFG